MIDLRLSEDSLVTPIRIAASLRTEGTTSVFIADDPTGSSAPLSAWISPKVLITAMIDAQRRGQHCLDISSPKLIHELERKYCKEAAGSVAEPMTTIGARPNQTTALSLRQ